MKPFIVLSCNLRLGEREIDECFVFSYHRCFTDQDLIMILRFFCVGKKTNGKMFKKVFFVVFLFTNFSKFENTF